jgi:NADH-quinone oxidoreductase subunit G
VALVKPVTSDLPLALLGTFEDLDAADTALLIGTDPYEAVPVVHLKLREAQRKRGQRLWAVAERGLLRETLTGRELVTAPGMVAAALARALQDAADHEATRIVAEGLQGLDVGIAPEELRALGQALVEAERLVVIWDGEDPEVVKVFQALAAVRGDRPTRVLPSHGPVSAWGATRVGIPTEYLAARRILEAAAAGEVRALVLWGVDPIRDFPDGDLAQRAIERCPEVYYAGWFPPAGHDAMTALLPTAAWGETTGTYVNMEGRLQVARAAANMPGEARPTRTILQAAARAFGKVLRFTEDWDPFVNQNRDLLDRPALTPAPAPVEPRTTTGDGFYVLVGDVVSHLHLPSEIRARTPERFPVRLHPDDMAALGLDPAGDRAEILAGERRFAVGVRADARIPRGRLFVPRGVADLPWNRLGSPRVAVARLEEVGVE